MKNLQTYFQAFATWAAEAGLKDKEADFREIEDQIQKGIATWEGIADQHDSFHDLIVDFQEDEPEMVKLFLEFREAIPAAHRPDTFIF